MPAHVVLRQVRLLLVVRLASRVGRVAATGEDRESEKGAGEIGSQAAEQRLGAAERMIVELQRTQEVRLVSGLT